MISSTIAPNSTCGSPTGGRSGSTSRSSCKRSQRSSSARASSPTWPPHARRDRISLTATRAIKAPAASMPTSVADGWRPATNPWWNSSLAAYRTVSTNAQAHGRCQAVVPCRACKSSSARIPNTPTWPILRMMKSRPGSGAKRRFGVAERAKISAAQVITGAQPNTCRWEAGSVRGVRSSIDYRILAGNTVTDAIPVRYSKRDLLGRRSPRFSRLSELQPLAFRAGSGQPCSPPLISAR